MKKLSLLLFTAFLNMAFFSCHPESITEQSAPQGCCDEGEDIPPPLPHLTDPSNGNGG